MRAGAVRPGPSYFPACFSGRFAEGEDLVGGNVLQDLERPARPADLEGVDGSRRAGTEMDGARARRGVTDRGRHLVELLAPARVRLGRDLHHRADAVAVALRPDES